MVFAKLSEIDRLVLKERIFKSCQCIFTITLLSPLREIKAWYFFESLSSFYPQKFCAKFDPLVLKKMKMGKNLQTDR